VRVVLGKKGVRPGALREAEGKKKRGGRGIEGEVKKKVEAGSQQISRKGEDL